MEGAHIRACTGSRGNGKTESTRFDVDSASIVCPGISFSNMTSPDSTRARAALLLLCGLPASGKSSLAARLEELLTNTPTTANSHFRIARVILVHFDDFLHAELARQFFSQEAWQRSRTAALERLMGALEAAMGEDESGGHVLVIADDNFQLRRCEWRGRCVSRNLSCPCTTEELWLVQWSWVLKYYDAQDAARVDEPHTLPPPTRTTPPARTQHAPRAVPRCS